MFKKKVRRNFRQRKDNSSDEDEHDEVNDEIKPPESSVQGVKQVHTARRGISCSSKANSNSSTPPHGVATEYSVTSLSDQCITTDNPDAAKRNPISFLQEKEGANESDFKLKRSVNKAVVFQARKKERSPVKANVPQQVVKQAVTASTTTLEALLINPEKILDSESFLDTKDVDVKDDSENSSAEDLPPDSTDETNSTISSSSTSSSASKTQRVSIPSAEKIRAAKAQRRKVRAQRDYIPLDEEQENESLIEDRTQDESDEDQGSEDGPDDHERRIDFAPKPKTLREQMAEKMGISGSDGSCSDSQEDEDQHLWEEQQIEKGVKRPQKPSKEHVRPRRQKKKVNIPETLPPISISVIKKRITGKLESLKEVHRAREAELRRMQSDMESARSSLESLENHPADDQLHFYRSMSIFTQNLVDCLSEKMVLINSVEMDMHSLYIDHAQVLLSQRREAVKQQSTNLQHLTYGTHPQTNGDAMKTNSTSNSELFEDFGNVPADSKPTDDQKAELQTKRADILLKSQEIFSDVQEDFSDVKKILSRFDEWRVSFPESYTNAYISLCLPKILAPLIRHQLIGWNPLEAEGEDFEALPWYYPAEKFCHGLGYEESENADKQTLPAIIEKTVLPKIQGFVELVWDPLSFHQSHCLTALCKRIQDDYAVFIGEQSKPVQAFIDAVIQILRSTVDNDVFIPLYPKTYLDDKTSPQFQFQNQQFWSAVKLLGNMALWDGVLTENVLKELMLDKLLNRYLMMTLLNESDPTHIIHKCKKVADCFPKSWFEEMRNASALSQMQNFSKHLSQTVDLLGKGSNTEHSASFRAVLSDAVKILHKIKAYEMAGVIAEKYNCTDLLQSLNT